MKKEEKFYTETALAMLRNRLGIEEPTQTQIEEMTFILFNVWLRRTIIFDKKLTTREKTCLYLAAQGKNAGEAAQMLGITERTVRAHRKEIMRKLLCKNMTHAVSLGIKYGYVDCME